MKFFFSGLDEDEVADTIEQVIRPILLEFGIDHDYVTGQPLPSAVTVAKDGSVQNTRICYFPAFERSRNNNQLQDMANALSFELGYPAYTLDTAIVAAINGQPV